MQGHELGLAIFNIGTDIYAPARVHITPGLQYKYHFTGWNIKAGFDHYGWIGDLGLDGQSINARTGVEKVFFNKWFHLTEGIDLVYRWVNFGNDGLNSKSEVSFGPAIVGGVICDIGAHFSICANADIEFFYRPGFKDWEVNFTPVRIFTVNYIF